jgi:phenylpyruvate tautomerase PptA (4-oxalocrotonate tautomerase family)
MFVNKAEEIEEIARELSEMVGQKPSDVLILIAKVLREGGE